MRALKIEQKLCSACGGLARGSASVGHGLLNDHGTPASLGLLLETFAEESDDLFLQSLAALGPAPGACQLFHAPAQALELD